MQSKTHRLKKQVTDQYNDIWLKYQSSPLHQVLVIVPDSQSFEYVNYILSFNNT